MRQCHTPWIGLWCSQQGSRRSFLSRNRGAIPAVLHVHGRVRVYTPCVYIRVHERRACTVSLCARVTFPRRPQNYPRLIITPITPLSLFIQAAPDPRTRLRKTLRTVARRSLSNSQVFTSRTETMKSPRETLRGRTCVYKGNESGE